MIEIRKIQDKNSFAVYERDIVLAVCDYVLFENNVHIMRITMDIPEKMLVDGLIRAVINYAALVEDMRYAMIMDSVSPDISSLLPTLGFNIMEKIDIEAFFLKKNCKE